MRRGARFPLGADIAAAVIMTAAAALVWLAVSASAAALFGSPYSFASHAFRAAATIALVVALVAAATRIDRASGDAASRHRPRARAVPAVALGVIAYLLPFTMAATIVCTASGSCIVVHGDAVDVVLQVSAVLVLVLAYEANPEELIAAARARAGRRRRPLALAPGQMSSATSCSMRRRMSSRIGRTASMS